MLPITSSFCDVPIQISVPHRTNEITAGPSETKFKHANFKRDILTKSCMWWAGCCWEWGQV